MAFSFAPQLAFLAGPLEAISAGRQYRRPVEDGLLADDGGDRSDLWHLQNGGIKATEKATQKAGKLCLMTGLPSFFEKFLVFRFTNAR